MNKIYEEILEPVLLPPMYDITQNFDNSHIDDLDEKINSSIRQIPNIECIKGKTIAIAVGSRGINRINEIVGCVIESLKRLNPKKLFIVPAMGSHGGAIADNQTKILEHLGISEDKMGIEIRSSMETTVIGHTKDGIPVHMDRNAANADFTVTIARIKPHSSFRGKFESGMIKMCVIGLGKQHGADFCHFQGMARMGENLEKIGKVFISNSNILFSLGIIENAYDQTCFIEAIEKNQIMEKEPALLDKAKSLLPKIPFKKIDLLIIDEFGKNITGTGMDCNIIQRFTSEHMIAKPFINRLVVLDLTDASDGNASGFGLADISTRKAFNKMEMEKTYPNLMTSRTVNGGKIPLIMENDFDAIRAGIKTAPDVDYNNLRIVRIKNTLRLDHLQVSEALLNQADTDINIIRGPENWKFDTNGNLEKEWV